MQNEKLFDLFQKEQQYLKKIEKDHPQLFKSQLQIDSKETLEKVGIAFPFNDMPLGYLKYHPFDFIVEEIQKDQKISTIEFEKNVIEDTDQQYATIYTDLVKIGISTIDAVNELATLLNIAPEKIGNAGIKDQNAVTGQKISIRGVPLEKVQNIKPKNFFLKNLELGKGAIQIGNLAGNRFTIFIRTKEHISQKQIEAHIKKVEEKGFWNFYWLQRFGNRLMSHYWGLFLMQGDYEKCVHSYFCDIGDRDLEFFKQLRKQAQKYYGNWQDLYKLFQKLPYSLRYELLMLEHLMDNPKDFTGALNKVPDQIRLWVYAYASYLFNSLLSYYATENVKCPKTLPLVLSMNSADQKPYEAFLSADKVPLKFGLNLKPFPYVRLSSRQINSQMNYEILGVKSLDEGIVISFSLDKGSYATTFLAHLFTLTGGVPIPDWLNDQKYDFKKLLDAGSIKDTYQYLEQYIVEREDII